jgi:glutathione S-transferase
LDLKKDTNMVKPILYTATLSPPGRAVVMTARAIGLDIEIKPINLLAGEHMTEDFLKVSGIRKLDKSGNKVVPY